MISRIISVIKACFKLFFYWLFWKNRSDFEEKFAVKIRKTFEQLGPTYIKLGQVLSMRPDYLPKVYCQELEKCLDSAEVLPTAVIKKQIHKELKRPVEQVFKEFDDRVLASASLSQVHRAVLKNGDEAVIKVLRPKIKSKIQNDLKLVTILVKLIRKKINLNHEDSLDLMSYTRHWLMQELDYKNEVANLEIIKKESGHLPNLIFPKIYKEFSTKNVLVLEYIKGYKLLDLINLKRQNNLPEFSFTMSELMKDLINTMANTGTITGHFHADLHPANIIITKEGKICLLDFGLIGYFNPWLRRNILMLFLGITLYSPDILFKTIIKINKYGEDFDQQGLYDDFSQLCDKYRDEPASKMSNSQFFVTALNISFKYGIRFPWPILLYGRSTTSVDGAVLNLCPEFIFTHESRQNMIQIYLKTLFKELTSLPNMIIKFEDLWETVKKSPEALSKILDNLSSSIKKNSN